MRATLIAGGWLYAGAIVFLSLTAEPVSMPAFAFGDKLQHFVAYAVLMFWFARLFPGKRMQLSYAALWIGMGVGLEFAQGATGARSFELADMAANALGVAAGALGARVLYRT